VGRRGIRDCVGEYCACDSDSWCVRVAETGGRTVGFQRIPMLEMCLKRRIGGSSLAQMVVGFCFGC
jgi:hypothetical protein